MADPVTTNERKCVRDGSKIKPHPDGKPWGKCCRGPAETDNSCQCFMRKPRNSAAARFDWFHRHNNTLVKSMIANGERFFCMHRTTEDGFYRECAGWAAKKHKLKLEQDKKNEQAKAG